MPGLLSMYHFRGWARTETPSTHHLYLGGEHLWVLLVSFSRRTKVRSNFKGMLDGRRWSETTHKRRCLGNLEMAKLNNMNFRSSAYHKWVFAACPEWECMGIDEPLMSRPIAFFPTFVQYPSGPIHNGQYFSFNSFVYSSASSFLPYYQFFFAFVDFLPLK